MYVPETCGFRFLHSRMEKYLNEHLKKKKQQKLRKGAAITLSSHVDLSNIQYTIASLCDSFNSLRVDISFSYSHSISLNQNL